jgi:hypothetical protein
VAKVNDLKKGLGSLKKKPIITEEKSENIVSKVHSELVEKEAPKKRGRKKVNIEKTTRYTIDIPETVYKALKHKLADDGGTMKSIIIRLLKNELNLK